MTLAPATALSTTRGEPRWLSLGLSGLVCGRLTLVLPSGRRIEHVGQGAGPQAQLALHRWRALRRLLVGGDVGFAQAHIDGDWSSPDLVALIELAALNIDALDGGLAGLAPVRLLRRLLHGRRRNSRRGSRRNIAFHYDLGNAFYALWLDESMTYSAARALPPGTDLAEAQRDKRARIVELLRPDAEASVLEIGCGWGALAIDLARSGARVSAITLSAEQLAHARGAVADAGVGDRVALRLQDYRTLDRRFDRIVSIEMLEAVGEAYWPVYFAALRAALAPGGRIVLQAITIRADRYESYRRRPDFIQTYIFPGGMLPTEAILGREAAEAGLVIVERETFGPGYAATLAAWRARFDLAGKAVLSMGFSEAFVRTWRYYLSYCEAGFRAGTIDVGLYVLEAA